MDFDRAIQDQILAAQQAMASGQDGISDAWLEYYKAMQENALQEAISQYENPKDAPITSRY